MLSRFVKRHSGFTRRSTVVIPEMVLVTMVMDVVPVTCTDTRATKSCAPARHRQHPPRLLSPRPGSLALVLVNPSPQPSSPSPAPVRTPMKTQAEPRALHSYYIEDMARNYATDCSDPSLEEDEAVRTHGLSPSEKRESIRLHHEDEAPCPRDRGSPTTTPCSTLKYIRALHPLELSRSSSSPLQLNNECSILSVG
jgi:hypothetical protein